MNDDPEVFWHFSFCLESEKGDPVSRTEATQLMENIIRYVEDRNLQVGGGFRAPSAEELAPGPIFEVDDDSEK